MNHINKNTDLKNIIKVSINNNITMSLTMEQHKKKILKPTIIKYKGLDWLNKENTEKKFIKKKMLELKTSYNNIKKLISKNGNKQIIEEYKKFDKKYCSVSPLLNCFNNVTDDIRCKINIEKKINNKKYPFTLFSHMNKENLSKFISKNNVDCYEILHNNNKRCVYFDYDSKIDKKIDNILECTEYKKIITDMNNIFKNPQLSVSGSCGFKKKIKSYVLSLHIIVNNYHFNNLEHQSLSNIKKLANMIGSDPIPYNSNQSFKLPNQSKKEDKKNPDRIQKILINTNYINHIIQNVSNDSKLVTDEIKNYLKNDDTMFIVGNTKINKIVNKKNHGISTFNKYEKLNIECPLIHHYHDDLRTIVRTLPTINLKYKEFYYIISCFVAEKIAFDEMWDIIKTRNYKNSTHDNNYWKKIYNNMASTFIDMKENKRINIIKYKRNKLFSLLEQFYGKIENKYVKTFKKYQLDTIKDASCFNKIIKTKFLNLNDIPLNEKLIILKLNMGAGKTNNINLLLRTMPEKSVISLTNRCSLAQNQLGEFNRPCLNDEKERIKTFLNGKNDNDILYNGNEFQHYKTASIYNNKKVVCEIESIGKNNIRKKYDIVIIDEIESLFLSFGSEKCMEKVGYNKNWVKFIDLILNAKIVIAMDAYISKRTTDFFKNLNKDFYLIGKENDKINKKVNLYNDFNLYLEQLKKDLLLNKRICIQYPYKSGKCSQYKLHIEDIKKMIVEECPNIKLSQVKVYHGDTKDIEKKQLIDVNSIWDKNNNNEEIKVIIYNSSISVGVNCNIIYDKLYITYANHIFPRSTIQGSMRFRTFKEDLIEMFIFNNPIDNVSPFCEPLFKKMSIDEEDLNYGGLYDNDKLYKKYVEPHKKLMRGVGIEAKSKNFETLKYLMDITGYEIIKYITTDKKNKKLSIKEIKEKWTPKAPEDIINFEDIINIDDATAKIYTDAQNKAEFYIDEDDSQRPNPLITFDQKQELKKYYINKMFIDKNKYKSYIIENDTIELKEKLNIKILNNTQKKNIFKNAKFLMTQYNEQIVTLKKKLYLEDFMREGINDIIKNNKLISLVIDSNFNINNNELSIKNKNEINKHYNIGNISNYSDNIIKKRLLRCHFKKDIIKVKNSKNVINDKMLLIFDLVQKYHIFYHSMKKKNNKILV